MTEEISCYEYALPVVKIGSISIIILTLFIDFSCSSCDSLFSTLMALEHHKEEFEHWSGEDCCHSISENSDEDTTYEMERLL